jgi:hypothetical protein
MLLALGFQRTPSEYAIYIRWNGDAQLVVEVYVDDLVITSSGYDDINSFKEEMATALNMSDLGLLHYYLDIEVNVDISYTASQAYRIVNIALHREYSPGIIFIFSQGRKDLYHV